MHVYRSRHGLAYDGSMWICRQTDLHQRGIYPYLLTTVYLALFLPCVPLLSGEKGSSAVVFYWRVVADPFSYIIPGHLFFYLSLFYPRSCSAKAVVSL